MLLEIEKTGFLRIKKRIFGFVVLFLIIKFEGK